jgi:hypothetical protein
LFLEALLDQDLDLEVLVLKNPSTPQWDALSWLVKEEALNPETAHGRDILEHFFWPPSILLPMATTGEIHTNFYKSEVSANGTAATVLSLAYSGVSAVMEVVKLNVSAWVSWFFYFMPLIRLGTAIGYSLSLSLSSLFPIVLLSRLQFVVW